jgi:hypothetical protein
MMLCALSGLYMVPGRYMEAQERKNEVLHLTHGLDQNGLVGCGEVQQPLCGMNSPIRIRACAITSLYAVTVGHFPWPMCAERLKNSDWTTIQDVTIGSRALPSSEDILTL